MEKFMYLFRGVPPTEETHIVPDDHKQKWMLWMKSLGEKGALVGGEPLQHTGKLVKGAKKVVSDGPFVEAKEIVGGYLVVNARDINEAAELSKGCPVFDYDGWVEVRPVANMEM